MADEDWDGLRGVVETAPKAVGPAVVLLAEQELLESDLADLLAVDHHGGWSSLAAFGVALDVSPNGSGPLDGGAPGVIFTA
jgi:hypothetical protein